MSPPLPERHTSPAKLGTLHNLVFSNIWDIIFNLKTVSVPDYLCSRNKHATFSFFSKDWNLWLKMKVQIRSLIGFSTEPMFLFLRLQGAHRPKTSEPVTLTPVEEARRNNWPSLKALNMLTSIASFFYYQNWISSHLRAIWNSRYW